RLVRGRRARGGSAGEQRRSRSRRSPRRARRRLGPSRGTGRSAPHRRCCPLSRHLLARGVPLSRDLQEHVSWTAEQAEAIERREGDLFLDAAAGSGKTSVLVERFVQAVLQDGVEVSAMLTITFTDKTAAQMR